MLFVWPVLLTITWQTCECVSVCVWQAKQRQEKIDRRQEKVQRIVQACPEVAAASQLQQLCSAVQVHVPDLEQSCIMVQWMMQEVADLGISGITWNPAKVSAVILTIRIIAALSRLLASCTVTCLGCVHLC